MSKVYVSAVAMLARREHGAAELVQKLLQKGYEPAEVEEALIECQRLNLQSDLRFAENVCRARIRQGYGPERVRNELQMKQIDRELIEQVLAMEDEQWLTYALEVWRKKYKQQSDYSYADVQKQKQFLLYRGFSMQTIAMVFEQINYIEF